MLNKCRLQTIVITLNHHTDNAVVIVFNFYYKTLNFGNLNPTKSFWHPQIWKVFVRDWVPFRDVSEYWWPVTFRICWGFKICDYCSYASVAEWVWQNINKRMSMHSANCIQLRNKRHTKIKGFTNRVCKSSCVHSVNVTGCTWRGQFCNQSIFPRTICNKGDQNWPSTLKEQGGRLRRAVLNSFEHSVAAINAQHSLSGNKNQTCANSLQLGAWRGQRILKLLVRQRTQKRWMCSRQSVIIWLLSVSTALTTPFPGSPPMLSSRMLPASSGLFNTGSEESIIIWFDSDSVLAGGATFSQPALSPASPPSPQSILKRVTLGHVARMFRWSCQRQNTTCKPDTKCATLVGQCKMTDTETKVNWWTVWGLHFQHKRALSCLWWVCCS